MQRTASNPYYETTIHMQRYIVMLACIFAMACHSGTVQTHMQEPGAEEQRTTNTESAEVVEGERIQGPARVRETVNGKLIFTLNDLVLVYTTAPDKGWLQVGIVADLTASEYACACIRKGSSIKVKGQEVGRAVEELKMEVYKTSSGLQGDVKGYTPATHIRQATVPESTLESIIGRSPNPSREEMQPFLNRFRFQSFHSLMPSLTAYEISDTWIENTSDLPRLWLLFENDELLGVIHSRPLNVLGTRPVKLQYGLHLTMIKDKDHAFVQKLIKEVTRFFNHAG